MMVMMMMMMKGFRHVPRYFDDDDDADADADDDHYDDGDDDEDDNDDDGDSKCLYTRECHIMSENVRRQTLPGSPPPKNAPN